MPLAAVCNFESRSRDLNITMNIDKAQKTSPTPHPKPVEQTAPEAGILGSLCPKPGVDGVGLGEPLAQEHDLHHHREVDLPHGGNLANLQQLGQHLGLVSLLPGDNTRACNEPL